MADAGRENERALDDAMDAAAAEQRARRAAQEEAERRDQMKTWRRRMQKKTRKRQRAEKAQKKAAATAAHVKWEREQTRRDQVPDALMFMAPASRRAGRAAQKRSDAERARRDARRLELAVNAAARAAAPEFMWPEDADGRATAYVADCANARNPKCKRLVDAGELDRGLACCPDEDGDFAPCCSDKSLDVLEVNRVAEMLRKQGRQRQERVAAARAAGVVPAQPRRVQRRREVHGVSDLQSPDDGGGGGGGGVTQTQMQPPAAAEAKSAAAAAETEAEAEAAAAAPPQENAEDEARYQRAMMQAWGANAPGDDAAAAEDDAGTLSAFTGALGNIGSFLKQKLVGEKSTAASAAQFREGQEVGFVPPYTSSRYPVRAVITEVHDHGRLEGHYPSRPSDFYYTVKAGGRTYISQAAQTLSAVVPDDPKKAKEAREKAEAGGGAATDREERQRQHELELARINANAQLAAAENLSDAQHRQASAVERAAQLQAASEAAQRNFVREQAREPNPWGAAIVSGAKSVAGAVGGALDEGLGFTTGARWRMEAREAAEDARRANAANAARIARAIESVASERRQAASAAEDAAHYANELARLRKEPKNVQGGGRCGPGERWDAVQRRCVKIDARRQTPQPPRRPRARGALGFRASDKDQAAAAGPKSSLVAPPRGFNRNDPFEPASRPMMAGNPGRRPTPVQREAARAARDDNLAKKGGRRRHTRRRQHHHPRRKTRHKGKHARRYEILEAAAKKQGRRRRTKHYRRRRPRRKTRHKGKRKRTRRRRSRGRRRRRHARH